MLLKQNFIFGVCGNWCPIVNGNDKIIIEVNFTIKIYKYFIKVSDPIIGTNT
jgi:hypothetical protein